MTERDAPQDASALENTLAGLMHWRLIGPHRAGRVVAVAGDPEEALTFYHGACAGGLWKTVDGGISWRNVTDGYLRTAAIGAVAVAPSDPNVLYVGTGEACIRGDVSHGDGVYRSTDAGATWTNVGLDDTRHIAKVRVHPTNPDLVYVAALGHAYGPNSERGVFRSSDGGAHWQRVLFRNEDTGACDLVIDQHNPRLLYAALWEVRRTPWSLTSGGAGSGLFRSTDGGDTWQELTNNPGLPTGVRGKVGIAVSPARRDRLWAIVEAEDGAVFRSDNGGATWMRLSEEADLRRRAWYYMHIHADPQDADTVWVLNIGCWRSIDGGRTFLSVPTAHGDNHDLWIDPRNTRRLIEGNDGGATVSFDGGLSWSSVYNQPTAQFYHVTTDDQFPYRVYGSQQDNSALSLPSRSDLGAITQLEWFEPGGGESGYIALKPDDQNIIVGGAIGSGAGHGRLICYDRRSGQKRNITVWPDVLGMGSGGTDLKYRFQWTFPISFSPHDPNVLYVTANKVLRSRDLGASWEEISPDLSRNDRTKMLPSGGPITRDNTGAELYGTIFAFQESPHEAGLFWAGTDDGLMHLSRDAGETWANITPPDLPEWTLISVIELSPHAAGTAYVAATRYKLDDFRPYLYKTHDYGQTWQRIVQGLPGNDFTRVIRADHQRAGLLFAGTETGLYISFDDGNSWRPARGNLPVVPIYDLAIKGDELVAATHGRSFWILDDITPLRQLDPAPAPAHLFTPRATYRLRNAGREANGVEANSFRSFGPLRVPVRRFRSPRGKQVEVLVDAGENPKDGIIVSYLLRAAPQQPVELKFLDRAGAEVRTFSSAESAEPPKPDAESLPTAKPGVNRFVWNLRGPDAVALPGDTATEKMLKGPLVPPGEYQVQLHIGDLAQTVPFTVLKDPRITASDDELAAQADLHRRIHEQLSAVHRTVMQLRDVRQQVQDWLRRSTSNAAADRIKHAGDELIERLTVIEQELVEPQAGSALGFPNRLNARLAILAAMVDSADATPPRQCEEVYAQLTQLAQDQVTRYQTLLRDSLPPFNALLAEAELTGVTAVESR
ncbi:MAG: VPS10 domain-containing protein [Chloroflexota bacterium]